MLATRNLQDIGNERFAITLIGSGDCNEYNEESYGNKDSGLDCALTCANAGFWMASWNGHCYCEENPHEDTICSSYTDTTGYS